MVNTSTLAGIAAASKTKTKTPAAPVYVPQSTIDEQIPKAGRKGVNTTPPKSTTPAPNTPAGTSQADIDAAAAKHQADMDAAKKAADAAAIAAGTMGSGPNGDFVPGDPGYHAGGGGGGGKTETGRITNSDGSTTIIYSDGSHDLIPFNSGLGGTGKATDLSQGTATDIFLNGLGAMGLKDLATGVQGLVKQGINPDGIAAWVRSQPSYATRFPAMAALNASGQGVSEAAYMQKEDTDRALLYTYLGPNAQAYDNYATLGGLISGFKSSSELQSNLQAYHDAVNSSPETKAWLKSNYGLTDQDLAAYWLNPKTAGDQIQLRMNASDIGGAAASAGFGQLTQAQAEALALQGVTQSQAQNEFAKLGNTKELQTQLPGNESGSLTQQQILDAGFNGGVAGQSLAQLQAARVAQFNVGGQFATDAQGVVGLKSAATQ